MWRSLCRKFRNTMIFTGFGRQTQEDTKGSRHDGWMWIAICSLSTITGLTPEGNSFQIPDFKTWVNDKGLAGISLLGRLILLSETVKFYWGFGIDFTSKKLQSQLLPHNSIHCYLQCQCYWSGNALILEQSVEQLICWWIRGSREQTKLIT